MGHELIERARVFATAAHAAVNQRRKYTLEPYIVHPTEVARIVSTVTGNPFMIAAAYLHDVLEDTKVEKYVLIEEFGQFVADYVEGLTDVSKESDGNRAVRKTLDLHHLAAQCEEVQTIKLADTIANTPSICKYDKDFAPVYLEEKRKLLSYLSKGHPALWAEAYELVWVQGLREGKGYQYGGV